MRPRKVVGSCSSPHINFPQNGPTYFELCVNTGEHLKSLGEIDVTRISTDGEFFALIKQQYLRLRSFRSRFFLLKPSVISYVRVCHLYIFQGHAVLTVYSSSRSKTVAESASSTSLLLYHQKKKWTKRGIYTNLVL